MKPFVKSSGELFAKGLVKVWEFGGSESLDVARAELKGVYPEQGLAVNNECDLFYLVINGEAKITLGDEEHLIKQGSVVFIPKKTPYKVIVSSDSLIVFMPSSPAWSPSQYEVI